MRCCRLGSCSRHPISSRIDHRVMQDFPLDSARACLTPGQRVQTPRCPQAVGIGNLREMKKGSIMSELSMHELEAQTGEVLPEREALAVGFAFGSFNHTTNHLTAVNANNGSNAQVIGSNFSAANSS